LTIYSPKLVNPHTNLSFSLFKLICMSCCRSSSHKCHLCSDNEQEKVIFKGPLTLVFAAQCYKRDGYCCAKDLFPNQVSSRNLVSIPLPTENEPLLKKSLLLLLLDPFKMECHCVLR
jgi:hypothetical protein